MSTENIEAVLDQATPQELNQGTHWYQDAHDIAAYWSEKYGVPKGAVVGVIGALSPCVGWERNLMDAKALIEAHVTGEDLDGLVVSAFNNNKAKAIKILQAGTRDGIIGGAKVTSFCDQIEEPDRGLPVIDRHAFNVWAGERVITKNKIPITKYRAAVEDYRLVAEARGMRADQVQAVTWLVWRRTAAGRA